MIVAAHILHQHLKLHQIMQDYVIILVGDELLGILISSSLPCLFVLHMQLVQPLSHNFEFRDRICRNFGSIRYVELFVRSTRSWDFSMRDSMEELVLKWPRCCHSPTTPYNFPFTMPEIRPDTTYSICLPLVCIAFFAYAFRWSREPCKLTDLLMVSGAALDS